jgi:hypothetical protein
MTKISKSFKSYISKLKWLEEKKVEAEHRKKAKKAIQQAEIFVSDRAENEADFHRSRKWG